MLGGGGVAGVGGKEADGAVAPVVVELISVVLAVVLHLVELEDGHKLHSVYAQLLKIWYLLPKALEGAGVRHP